jgi:hypothetical protein
VAARPAGHIACGKRAGRIAASVIRHPESIMDQQKKDSESTRAGTSPEEIERNRHAAPASSHPSKEGPARHRATSMDGNPNPEPAPDDASGLKPRDDTPTILPSKKGPADRGR